MKPDVTWMDNGTGLSTGGMGRVLALLVFAAALTGCATVQTNLNTVKDSLTDTVSPDDPIEPVNRAIYEFNDAFDRVLLQPVAKGYVKVVPLPVRNCFRNIFSNFGDVPTALNNTLQGKLGEAASDVGRLALNSTVGILGCFDVASEVGLEKHKEDFGQTLGTWGVPSGPYLMLPFFGPSTVRDAFGTFAVDNQVSVIASIDHVPTRNETYALSVIDTRASLLDARGFIQGAALDPYVFIREAYLGRRRNQINEGNGVSSYEQEESDGQTASAAP